MRIGDFWMVGLGRRSDHTATLSIWPKRWPRPDGGSASVGGSMVSAQCRGWWNV